MQAAWKALFRLGKSSAGRRELSQALGLCSRAAPRTSEDVEALAEWLQAAWDYLAMGNCELGGGGRGGGGKGGGPGSPARRETSGRRRYHALKKEPRRGCALWRKTLDVGVVGVPGRAPAIVRSRLPVGLGHHSPLPQTTRADPYPSGYMLNGDGQLPAYPVRVACQHLADPHLAEDAKALLRGLGLAAGVFYNHTGSLACFDWAQVGLGRGGPTGVGRLHPSGVLPLHTWVGLVRASTPRSAPLA